MKLVPNIKNDFLRNIRLFKGLPERDMKDLVNSAVLKTYKKGEYIYHQGDKADRFFIVMSGWIRLYKQTIEGDDVVSAMLTSKDIFGEGIIFYQSNSYIFSAQVAEQANVFEISKATLRLRANDNPEILKRIMDSVCDKMIKLQTENESLSHKCTTQRVGCLLLRLAAKMVGTGGTYTFPYDKSMAAAQLGMKRETFSRSLTQLKSLGVTVHGAEITIDDFKTVMEFSCGQCPMSPQECAGAKVTFSNENSEVKVAKRSRNFHDA